MEDKQQNEKCTCERIQQVGDWGGEAKEGEKSSGGPKVKCKDCAAEFNLTWEQWDQVPEENKIAMA